MVGIASILVYLSTQTTILAWSPRQVANTTSLLPANITSAAAESASSILTSISASSAAASPAIASESSQASSDSAASPVPTGQAPPVTSGGGEYNASLVQSPPYPYPLDSSLDGNSYYISPRWSAAHQKARDYLSGWTQEEKVNLTTGVGWQVGRCVGNIPAIPSQGFPGLCLEDSPLGVRFADHVSAFPAGINVASTFDKDLMYARGYAMAEEFKGKGVHIALGPMTNMARVAAGGRNWEGFGGDPYLAGWATEMTIKGMQDAGVQACVKHYIGNEQERNRTTSSSNIDDRTMREIYTHPFLRAVAADVASVMCAYNLINNSWACQNEYTQNGILKTDFGFQGYILSDWQATESGVSSVNAGLDMTMPGDVVFFSRTSYFGQNLTTAVNNGSVASARLDDMAERILAGWFLLEQDQDFPEVNFDAFRRNSTANNSFVDVRSNHDEVIRHIGAASIVLLKNTGSLPLHKPKSIALIGSDAGPSMFGPNGCEDRGCDYGTLAMGWGSGTADFPYLIDPYTAISLQARHDHSTFDWTFDNFDLEAAQERAGGVEVAIVAIHADSGEQYITFDGNEGDRNNLTAWRGGDDLVNAVAAVNNNTIVMVHAVGPIVLEAWIDHPNVTGVLWAGLPGQESGNSLVDVMYGSYNPSGRLPYTIAKRREDYSADIIYVNTDVPATPQVDYTEGLDIDYRHFLSKDIEPRFGFGFGLSYTKFNYTNLQLYGEGVSKRDNEDPFSVNSTTTYNSTAPSNSTAPYNSTTAGVTNSTAGSHNGTTSPVSPTGQNGTTLGSGGQVVKVGRFMSDWLQRPRWTVTVDVQNVGPVDGCNVPQLYLEYPEGSGEPPRVLRDFARINLQPWQAEQVKWTLSQYDISIWDVVSQDWIVPEGEFGIVVADNAFDKGLRVPFCPWGKC